jgi:hypothetical protein
MNERLTILQRHVSPDKEVTISKEFLSGKLVKEIPKKRTLKVEDSLTGKIIEIPVDNETVLATEFVKLNVT